MRMLGVSLAVALVAVGCGGAVPSSPDAAVLTTHTTDAAAMASAEKAAPRACAVLEVTLTAEPSTRYRRAYQVEASYLIAHQDYPCGSPTWSVSGRAGRILFTKNPFVVHVQSTERDHVLTVEAMAPNGRSASQDLKF